MSDRTADILEAAQAVFSEFGYHASRIEEIAERAGVAKGTVYLYFPGKQELFLALIQRAADDHLRRVEAILSGPGTLEERLTEMARRHLSLYRDKKDLDMMAVQELMRSEEICKKQFADHINKYIYLISSALQRVGDEGAPNPEAAPEAALALIGMLHIFHLKTIEDLDGFNEEELPCRLIAIFLRGITGL